MYEDDEQVWWDMPATESEAHNEWHTNAGWDRVCPWDCNPDPDPVEYTLTTDDIAWQERQKFPRHRYGLMERLHPSPF